MTIRRRSRRLIHRRHPIRPRRPAMSQSRKRRQRSRPWSPPTRPFTRSPLRARSHLESCLVTPSRIWRDLVLPPTGGALVLCPVDRLVLDALEAWHGSVTVADFDAARLAFLREETGSGQMRLLAATPDRLAELEPAGGEAIAFVDIDGAPSKKAAMAMIGWAARWSRGHTYVKGMRTSGVESLLARAELAGLLVRGATSRKGMTVARLEGEPGAVPSEVEALAIELRGLALALESNVFVFAGGGLDAATTMLAEAIQLGGRERVLDLGCGAGVVGITLAEVYPGASIVMSDSNLAATALSRRNSQRGTPGAADTVSGLGASPFRPGALDVVAVNPPFHRGRQITRTGGASLVDQAFAACRNGGAVYIVANRFLPYERQASAYGEVEEVAGDGRFKVLRCIKARRRDQDTTLRWSR
ncbi:MAG: methyltransferase [Dehalococcoidia bacterium]|nr:methyltransferase [Dehalococcoidia bacterium]